MGINIFKYFPCIFIIVYFKNAPALFLSSLTKTLMCSIIGFWGTCKIRFSFPPIACLAQMVNIHFPISVKCLLASIVHSRKSKNSVYAHSRASLFSIRKKLTNIYTAAYIHLSIVPLEQPQTNKRSLKLEV